MTKLDFSEKISFPIHSLGLGVFDGVHIGHQSIINQCDAVMTFEPHPDIVLGKKHNLQHLTTTQELIFYIPHLIKCHFNHELSKFSANQFLEDIILKKIDPSHIIVGYDYRFGFKREGDVSFLKSWACEKNINVTIVKPIKQNETIIKSSKIRTEIQDGDFEKAIHWLGHDYLLSGIVIKGEGRGKKLGFPTANIQVPIDKCIPQNGVYKGYCLIKNETYKAMIYIGTKPTFSSRKRNIEVFIKDFDDNIYGERLSTFIEKKLRNEKKFDSSSELSQQIKNDIHDAFHT